MAMVLPSGTVRAEAFTVTEPIAFALPNPCIPGEVVTGTGTMHQTINVIANGNLFHIKSNTKIGMTGVGSLTAARYNTELTFEDETNVAAGAEFTSVQRALVIRQAEASFPD